MDTVFYFFTNQNVRMVGGVLVSQICSFVVARLENLAMRLKRQTSIQAGQHRVRTTVR